MKLTYRVTYFNRLISLRIISLFLLFGGSVCVSSCKKFVAINAPVTKLVSSSVYQSDATAIAVLNGIYTQLSLTNNNATPRIPNISMWLGLSADEFTLWNGGFSNQVAYYKNSLSASTGYGTEFWTNTYPLVFICNSAIEGLSNSNGLTPAVKNQLLGEAKFLRAFFYFYLVNLYGDVPLVLTSDYTANAVAARTSSNLVYKQLISDLKDAKGLLNDSYVKNDAVTIYSPGSAERVRPNKWAAEALLARAYLYTTDWADAETESTQVLNNSTLYNVLPLNNVFLKNSQEAIWQLQPVTSGTITNTADAVTFIIPSTGPSSSYPVSLAGSLLNSFEVGDKRKVSGNWIDSVVVSSVAYYYPTKYKVKTANASVTEYTMILRLAEQYLIRAEARAQLNKLVEAQSDLNIIRSRAGLPNTTAATQSALVTAILHERQVELFTELGHRWLDLKRTNNIDAVMTAVSAQKGRTWNSYQQWFPIPTNDLLTDPNLVQNNGY